MNKKGISEIVSYVLLIVIAIGMAILIYSFLKLYVPKEKPECMDGISISIKDYTCRKQPDGNFEVETKITNTGRFSIDGAYLRIGNPDREARIDISDNILFSDDLPPESSLQHLSKKILSSEIRKHGIQQGSVYKLSLQVQPFHYTKGTDIELIALCSSIEQTINCDDS